MKSLGSKRSKCLPGVQQTQQHRFPRELILMLFDGATALPISSGTIAEGDLKGPSKLIRAQDIMTELMVSLDMIR